MDKSTWCVPRYATPRTESRETLGRLATKYGKALGYPLMPWQQYVFDVALEIDPKTKRFAYQFITITVPRQCGKTTLLEVLVLLRGLGHGYRQKMVYGAQDRNMARRKLFDDWRPVLEDSPFNPHIKFRATNGSEQLQLKGGSTMDLTASLKSSGQGMTADLVIIDEAFDFTDNRMDTNFMPTLRTRRNPPPGWDGVWYGPQMWIVSTAGTPESSKWLLSKVEKGRVLVEDQVRSGTCYFEWSAEDDDPADDPATWRKCTPALGYTINEEAIRSELNNTDLSSFARFGLNRWVESVVDPVFSLERWDALLNDSPAEQNGSWAIGFDVSEDRTFGSIAAASMRADGKFLVEVIERRAGTGWMAEFIANIWHKKRPVGIFLDRHGPAGSLLTDLETLNVPVLKRGQGTALEDISTSDFAKACGLWYDGCIRPEADGGAELYHRTDTELRTAFNNGVKRSSGDAWVFSRKQSPVDISSLIAVVMAFYGIKQHSRAPVVHDLSEIIARKKREAAGDKTGPVTPVGDDVPAPKRSGKGSFTPL